MAPEASKTDELRNGGRGANAPEFSVNELAHAIKRTLEGSFGYVRLRGEVSGYRGPHSSGHCYFSLKDEKARIDAVIWRGVFQKLKVKPEEGMEVIARGRVTTYPGSSKYQIVVESLEPAGVGALMALLEERKKKLTAEGLFDESRKQQLPFLPRVVGVITSPTGAVIRDMLAGFTERFPTRVLLWPVRVQGETCAPEVASAVAGFNALPVDGPLPRPDVLIVARGGGSLEDLWGFNEESVVRAVAESRLPVISAVGHETDWTLIDLVADARAPTPTKAAEWAVPKYADLIEQTGGLTVRLRTAVVRVLDHARTDLKAAMRGLPRLEEILALPRQRFDAAEKRLGRALLSNTNAHKNRLTASSARLSPSGLFRRISEAHTRVAEIDGRRRQAFSGFTANCRRQFDGQYKLLQSLSYQSVLARGYALVRDQEGAMIRSHSNPALEQEFQIEFADGKATIPARGQTSPGGGTKGGEKTGRSKSQTAPAPKGRQGSLF